MLTSVKINNILYVYIIYYYISKSLVNQTWNTFIPREGDRQITSDICFIIDAELYDILPVVNVD